MWLGTGASVVTSSSRAGTFPKSRSCQIGVGIFLGPAMG